MKKNRILLIDSTTETATVGLLQLASFLRRNGIESYCQYIDNNLTYASIERNVVYLLTKINPSIVGVSFKWFLHMSRGLEICKLIKKHNPYIKIVIGGNTASYFWKDFIKYDFIDYIIRGDGELPLLKLCNEEEEIPNCVYKSKGNIVETPFNYVHSEKNSSEIYLSHLDEILVGENDLNAKAPIFIYAGKGCSANCFYCGGCNEANIRNFNRSIPFLRDINEFRKDIIEAKKYTSSFIFDFDLIDNDICDYYINAWDGIDLSADKCAFYFWNLPKPEFIQKISETFSSARIGIDLCSLSERHRLYLSSLKAVKPQISDNELISCIKECEIYGNLSVQINTILGMPYQIHDDLKSAEELISNLKTNFSCFSYLSWGRLHAQPGAPILNDFEKYEMLPSAVSFEQFMNWSKQNFDIEPYPNQETYFFPAFYYKDASMIGNTYEHFMKIDQLLRNK